MPPVRLADHSGRIPRSHRTSRPCGRRRHARRCSLRRTFPQGARLRRTAATYRRAGARGPPHGRARCPESRRGPCQRGSQSARCALRNELAPANGHPDVARQLSAAPFAVHPPASRLWQRDVDGVVVLRANWLNFARVHASCGCPELSAFGIHHKCRGARPGCHVPVESHLGPGADRRRNSDTDLCAIPGRTDEAAIGISLRPPRAAGIDGPGRKSTRLTRRPSAARNQRERSDAPQEKPHVSPSTTSRPRGSVSW